SALSPVTLVNLSFRLSYSGVTLRGSIYNLLDTGNCSPAPFSKKIDDYPHPGRTFLLSLEYRIGD
ncbi:MAG: TonB-dependent receptor, partial [bacterium]|nr:TonB-dependent receptor [bacterium]